MANIVYYKYVNDYKLPMTWLQTGDIRTTNWLFDDYKLATTRLQIGYE